MWISLPTFEQSALSDAKPTLRCVLDGQLTVKSSRSGRPHLVSVFMPWTSGGTGIALLPHFVGRGEATLVDCEMKEAPPSRELWLLIRRDGVTNLATKT